MAVIIKPLSVEAIVGGKVSDGHLIRRNWGDQWLLVSRGFFTGCVPDGLEEAVATEEGAKLVRAAIRSLMQALGSAPRHLSKDVLNLMGFVDSTFTLDIETHRLVEVGHAFLDLLDGKINSDGTDTSFMPGSR